MEVLIIWGSFFAVGSIFTLWENIKPAVPFGRRPKVHYDLAAFVVVFAYFLLVGVTTSLLLLPALQSSKLMATIRGSGLIDMPLWLRIIVFYLVWDMLMYWVHRLMHVRFVWPIHKWHHAPKAIWWLVGIRGSLPHIALTYLPFLTFYLMELPLWLVPVISVGSVAGNAWMHVNVGASWMRWLEYVFVTPRTHRIHHSDRPEHFAKNLGSLFSIWDRIFGTYIDPDTVDEKAFRFGNGEDASAFRLAVGF